MAQLVLAQLLRAIMVAQVLAVRVGVLVAAVVVVQ
jgi:hypothetical protein